MAKILIVDDDPDIVEASRLVLTNAGHDVVAASSRDEGMLAAKKARPDLIILDVMMEQPDDGIAMAQMLRREGFKKPILMLTSLGRAAGLDVGRDDELVPVDDYQEKPIKPDALVSKVAGLLEKAK